MDAFNRPVLITIYDISDDSAKQRVVNASQVEKADIAATVLGPGNSTRNSTVTREKGGMEDFFTALESVELINYLLKENDATTEGLSNLVSQDVVKGVVTAGSSQSDATALTAEYNIVATNAANTQGLKLPAIAPFLLVTIVNNTANSFHLYGASTDYIGTVAGATGIVIPANSRASFYAKKTAVTNVSGKGWQQL